MPKGCVPQGLLYFLEGQNECFSGFSFGAFCEDATRVGVYAHDLDTERFAVSYSPSARDDTHCARVP